MENNPFALIVGTGAAVLIARTFYESFNSARRGHPSAVPKKESRSKRSSRLTASSSKESSVNAVGQSLTSSPASGSGSSEGFAKTRSSVDQRIADSADEANAESNVSRPSSRAEQLRSVSQEMSGTVAVDSSLVVDHESARQSVDIGSLNEAAVNHSLDVVALAQTSAAHEPEDYIQLHSCSHLPEVSTEQSQSGVHVSVDIKNKLESGVHVSVDVMPKTDLARVAANVEQNYQGVMKELEGSSHYSERFEMGVLRLESNGHAKEQFELVRENAVLAHENNVRELTENGYENFRQRSGSHGSRKSAHSERSSKIAVKSPAENSARDSEHSAHVDRDFEAVRKMSENDRRLSEFSALAAVGSVNVSEHSGHDEEVVKQPEIARVSEQSAKIEHDLISIDQLEPHDGESENPTVNSVHPENENEDQNILKITSSGIDQEIRRSIAEESLKNAPYEDSGVVVGDSSLRPETPAIPFDIETVRSTIQALSAIYNELKKYNRDANNYLMQMVTAKCDTVAEGDERPTNNISGVPVQGVFYNSLVRDKSEDTYDTAQTIDTMNEFLVSDSQDEDAESDSAGSEFNGDSNAESGVESIGNDHAVEEATEEVQEIRTRDESNSEEQSNTTTSTTRDSLVICIKDRDEKDDSRTDGFEFEVVSCTPNIFQNVIVRKILKD